MKIALAGIGKIARDQHVPAIRASRDWELAATVSRHGTVEGVESFSNIAALLDARPDIETISLCLPPVPRFASAVAAIGAGRNVMLEKPPGATLTECRTLETMAREAGVSIFATWHSREAAQVAAAKAWLADRRILRLKITWKEDVRRWHPGQAWIWQPGGLGVFDPGINALSILTEILPDPIHIASATLSFPENCETPIAADLIFAHPSGAQATAEFDFRQQGEQTWTIEIETTAGSLRLLDGGAKLLIDGVIQEVPCGANGPLNGEYPRLYAKMATLAGSRGIDMDLTPMALVADAFLLGRRVVVEPFHE
ncbi:Gfo/Idh/MocA family oxidoreductase [Stappia sp. F7233]|uniref:Gfo/Idh/MocA family oxidoreductase n=2 Tax=Stappia albiluteola TaxID=2758565 RepID=A0A839A988_9HYPH|nr:Gfo/Idh/MocA family oxidoreductase [Stappia albiluteola]